MVALTATAGNSRAHAGSHWRALLWQMVASDLRGRYAGSMLGLFWNVIHPLVMVGIYTLVFSQVIGARLGAGSTDRYAFSIYLCAGLLPWNAFHEVVRRSTVTFLENANLVKKVAFPRLLLHLQIVIAAAINAALVIGIFLLFLAYLHRLPSAVVLGAWLGFIVVQLVLAAGIGLIASVVNVFFRDVDQVVGILLPLWFWLTPIVYVVGVLPPAAQAWMRFNVLYHFTRIHQSLLLEGRFPAAAAAGSLVLLAVLPLLAGLQCYRLARRRIADEL